MSVQKKKITILNADVPFTAAEKKQWNALGDVTWSEFGKSYTPGEILPLVKEAEYVALDPGALGGFEGLEEKMQQILPKL